MANMKIQYVIAKHVTANPSNLLAPVGGEHIYNIKIATDTDNGCLIAPDLVGDMVSYDVFNEASVNGFSGKIVDKMSNGNWLVFVENAGNACLVYQTPIAPEEWTKEWKKESNMYNKAGDVVRCYALHEGDRFEVSADAFSGDPAIGGTISSVTGKKMDVASGATSGNMIVILMDQTSFPSKTVCETTYEKIEEIYGRSKETHEPIGISILVKVPGASTSDHQETTYVDDMVKDGDAYKVSFSTVFALSSQIITKTCVFTQDGVTYSERLSYF